MTRSSSVIAIIPARGGSKGIPRKNIVDLGGYPLIAYTIAAARACREIDRVVVTTDDAEIADIAKRFGSEVVLRPKEIAMDDSSLVFATGHVLHWLRTSEGFVPTIKVTLLPTYPFRDPRKIDKALCAMKREGSVHLASYYEPEVGPRFFYLSRSSRKTPIRFPGKRTWVLASGSLAASRYSPYYDPSRGPTDPNEIYSKIIIPYHRRLANLGITGRGRCRFVALSDMESIDIDHPEDLNLAHRVLEERLFDAWYLQGS